MSEKQTEAQRLADECATGYPLEADAKKAANELRRLHAETTNQQDWYVEWKKWEEKAKEISKQRDDLQQAGQHALEALETMCRQMGATAQAYDAIAALRQATESDHIEQDRHMVRQAEPAEPHQIDPVASPTAGMNLWGRILHVGGRENANGYIEFGSVMAVGALIKQVLRDTSQQLVRQPLTVDQLMDVTASVGIPYGNLQVPIVGIAGVPTNEPDSIWINNSLVKVNWKNVDGDIVLFTYS